MAEQLTPLEHIRILDLSRYLPGPYLTRVLADLGADVIKVEDPFGDPARYLPPMKDGLSAVFRMLNWGKRSVAIDLKREEGIGLMLALAARVDVVVESFRPGVLDRLGIGYAVLVRHNPGVVLCSITGYGQDGCMREVPGHDLNYLARGGVLASFGPPNGPPVVPGTQIADLGAGALHAAVGVLATLMERAQTGRGRHLDISMTRSLSAFACVEHARRAAGDCEPRGAGMLSGGRPCYRVYETRDGKFMALAALEPKFFQDFCERAGCTHLADKGMAVGEEGAATIAELDELFATKSQQEWVYLLSQSESCCEPVLQPEEALADPGVNAPRVRVDQATLFGTHFGVAPAVPNEAHAPELGEHGRAVMHALGIDTRLVERAIAGGVLSPGRELS